MLFRLGELSVPAVMDRLLPSVSPPDHACACLPSSHFAKYRFIRIFIVTEMVFFFGNTSGMGKLILLEEEGERFVVIFCILAFSPGALSYAPLGGVEMIRQRFHDTDGVNRREIEVAKHHFASCSRGKERHNYQGLEVVGSRLRGTCAPIPRFHKTFCIHCETVLFKTLQPSFIVVHEDFNVDDADPAKSFQKTGGVKNEKRGANSS
jgi:hypothetical protein